jgi:hypothetical protein
MVGGVSSMQSGLVNSTVQLSNILRVQYAHDKIAMPVSPNQAVYARFEHIQGIPASEGRPGLSVSKLHILNTMIDKLVQLKGESARAVSGPGDGESELEGQISSLQKQIMKQISAMEASPYGSTYGLGLKETGTLFNLLI